MCVTGQDDERKKGTYQKKIEINTGGKGTTRHTFPKVWPK